MESLDTVLRVIASLNQAGVDYAVVGGVALNVHGLIRATEGLDLFVRPDPDNIERLRRALKAVWSDPDIDQITAEDLCGDYPAVRYGPPEGTLYLDILTRLGEATRFADLDVEDKEIEGVRVRVATPATLYAMKKDTVRPIDRADARARAFSLCAPSPPRGVQRFRSIEAANAAREQATLERMKRTSSARARETPTGPRSEPDRG